MPKTQPALEASMADGSLPCSTGSYDWHAGRPKHDRPLGVGSYLSRIPCQICRVVKVLVDPLEALAHRVFELLRVP